jgi:hypothetical protein
MTEPKNPAKKSSSRVDWDDPLIASLLKKTESWQLDNRGSFAAQDVEVHLGWGAGSARPGVVVWEQGQVTVLETDFPIEQGELVRIDKQVGGVVQTSMGTLVESRPGNRAHDQPGDVFVHWISVR